LTSSAHAIVPLALLEAIRNLDTPIDDGLAELAVETVSRRLGMSTTVAAQIERYREAAAKDASVGVDEAVQVFRLVGRRSDAALVYADAGRRAARLAAGRRKRPGGPLGFLLPRSFRRRLGERRAERIAARVFGLALHREGSVVALRLAESLATQAGYADSGCLFYGALVSELFRVTSGFEGAMAHERCVAKGDRACEWRAVEAEQW
jgi:hypothetical protein